jgi:hypothetical protein
MRNKTETSRNTSLVNDSRLRDKTPKSNKNLTKTYSKSKDIKPNTMNIPPTNKKIIIKSITQTKNIYKTPLQSNRNIQTGMNSSNKTLLKKSTSKDLNKTNSSSSLKIKTMKSYENIKPITTISTENVLSNAIPVPLTEFIKNKYKCLFNGYKI